MIATTKQKRASTATIPAVAYIRMSSSKQEASPERQREEITRLAERHGYHVVREYSDEAVSGAATHKRHGFLRMVKDAETKGDFRVILVWDLSRFGRFDSVESGKYVDTLRRASVELHTVTEGRIDWTTFGGRLLYTINQEAKNQFLVDLSHNIRSGLRRKAERGQLHCLVPYGMVKEVRDETGSVVRCVRYGERFRVPRTWSSRLVPDDGEQRKVVEWIFREFAGKDMSIRSLAIALTEQGVASPRGTDFWGASTVRQILMNPAYAGIYRRGVKPSVKFSSADPLIVLEDNHPAIVSRKIFDKAQARLFARREKGGRGTKRSRRLSGLLRCGHCGGGMALRPYKKDGRARDLYYFHCFDVRRCHTRMVSERWLESLLCRYIQLAFMSPEAEGELRRAVERRARVARAEASGASAERRRLTRSLKELEKKIRRGESNLVLLERDEIPAARKALSKLREQRGHLEASLEALGAAGAAAGRSVDEAVAKAMSELGRLYERLGDADTVTAREAFRALFARVRLFWHPRNGQRNWKLARIEIEAGDALDFVSTTL